MNDSQPEPSKVNRPRGFTRDDLIEHIKAVGQRIIDDAERIATDPTKTSYIDIEAEISPSQEVTKVKYHITQNADPRFDKARRVD